MIDLNALTLYKKKISSYIDNDILDISTKSNILNMFKIKNFTGNGIKINGNVKIDENGIASNFDYGSYVNTYMSADILNVDNFELQTKFRLSSLRPSNNAYYVWSATCDGYDPPRSCLCSHEFSNNHYTFYGFWVNNGGTESGNYIISDKYTFPYTNENQLKNAIVGKWFTLNQKFTKDEVETTLFDENDNVMYNNTKKYKYRPNSFSTYQKWIIFGNISNSYGQPTNVSFDLSECYIKIDDELVSTWNM